MTPIPIPKPESMAHLGELWKIMQATHTKNGYTAFKSNLRHYAEKYLVAHKLAEEQDQVAWNQFVDKLVQLDIKYHGPRLAQYDNYWPIEFYYNFIVTRAKNQQKKKKPSPPHPQQSGSTVGLNGRWRVVPQSYPPVRRMFVGKPPPDLNAGSSNSSTIRSPTSTSNGGGQEMPLRVPPPNQTPVRSSGNSAKSTVQVLIGCFQCGRIPAYPVEYSKGLHAFLNGNQDYTRILAIAGFATDDHLKIFLGWSKEEHATFFKALDMNEITPWNRLQLSRRFAGQDTGVAETQAGGGSGSGFSAGGTSPISTSPTPRTPTSSGNKRKASPISDGNDSDLLLPSPSKRYFSGILHPGPEKEEEITSRNAPLVLLRNAMQMENQPQLFDEIINQIEKGAADYFFTYRPTTAQLERTVQAISSTRLIFERFEGDWPIRFYIKRRIRILGNKPIDESASAGAQSQESSHWNHASSSSLSQSSSIFSKPSSSKSPGDTAHHQTPDTETRASALPVISYTCPVHPGVDTSHLSPNIKRFLHSRGLAELIPAFVLVGIAGDEQFKLFCETATDGERQMLFADAAGIRLNAFQRQALRLEVTYQKLKSFLHHFS